MNTVVKILAAITGLIALAYIFPMVKNIYEWTEGNGTGILYYSGTTALGTPTNNAIIAFFPYLAPVIFFVAIIIYLVVGRNKDEGGGQQ